MKIRPTAGSSTGNPHTLFHAGDRDRRAAPSGPARSDGRKIIRVEYPDRAGGRLALSASLPYHNV